MNLCVESIIQKYMVVAFADLNLNGKPSLYEKVDIVPGIVQL
ncbi:MAG: hypothetical protein E6778_14775 [Niallia nealsonii]|nr:hypothetical protein [Niallia nealsonii]